MSGWILLIVVLIIIFILILRRNRQIERNSRNRNTRKFLNHLLRLRRNRHRNRMNIVEEGIMIAQGLPDNYDVNHRIIHGIPPNIPLGRQIIIAANFLNNDNNIINNLEVIDFLQNNEMPVNNRMPVNDFVPILDTQNTHNSGITNTVKESIINIKKTIAELKPSKICFEEVTDTILKNLLNDKAQNALKTLETIRNSTIPHGYIEMTETQILQLIWSRICMEDKEKQKTLKENFVNCLSEGIEHGQPICMTGRINKMVESLNLAIDEVTIVPIEDVKTILHNKAGKLMKKFIEEKKIDEEKMSDDEYVKMKEYILDELKKEFCGKALSKEQFDTEIATWIDTI